MVIRLNLSNSFPRFQGPFMTGSRDYDFHRGKRPAPQRPGTREGLQLPITPAIQPPFPRPPPPSKSTVQYSTWKTWILHGRHVLFSHAAVQQRTEDCSNVTQSKLYTTDMFTTLESYSSPLEMFKKNFPQNQETYNFVEDCTKWHFRVQRYQSSSVKIRFFWFFFYASKGREAGKKWGHYLTQCCTPPNNK